MKEHKFALGMTMGLAAGAALGLSMTPRKQRTVKKAADRAVRTVEEMMEAFSEELGLR